MPGGRSGKDMTNSWLQAIRRWISMRVLKQPVRQQPRKECEHHAAGCYLCPREHCSGALNDRDDPDLTKPRWSSSGHCIYLSGASGGLGLRLRTCPLEVQMTTMHDKLPSEGIQTSRPARCGQRTSTTTARWSCPYEGHLESR